MMESESDTHLSLVDEEATKGKVKWISLLDFLTTCAFFAYLTVTVAGLIWADGESRISHWYLPVVCFCGVVLLCAPILLMRSVHPTTTKKMSKEMAKFWMYSSCFVVYGTCIGAGLVLVHNSDLNNLFFIPYGMYSMFKLVFIYLYKFRVAMTDISIVGFRSQQRTLSESNEDMQA